MKLQKGFSMIELLIVMAIIGILASVAFPAYNEYVLRGKLVEASATISNFRIRMEQYYQDNKNYGSTAAGCGLVPPVPPFVKYFVYSCNWGATASDQSYVITATGIAGLGTGGFSYTINEANAKTSTSTAWGTNGNCWIMKRGDKC